MKFIKIILVLQAMLVLANCAVARKKVDPTTAHTTEGGFTFKFPMSGDWYEVDSGGPGQYVVGGLPEADGSTKIALVKHAAIQTPGGKPMTNKEMLDGFKKQIEQDSEGGRAVNVKSLFTQQKYLGADCLFVDQRGEDRVKDSTMPMAAFAKICLHPKRKYEFIWMGISERKPLGKAMSPSLESDKKQFFESLQFESRNN